MELRQALEKYTWNPFPSIEYKGPYSFEEIQNARSALIREVRKFDLQLRRKTGIFFNAAEMLKTPETKLPISYMRDPNQGTQSIFDYFPTASNSYQPFHSNIPVRHHDGLVHLPNKSCVQCLQQYAASQFSSRFRGTTSVIKCDMCPYIEPDGKKTMQKHLMDFSHRSASRYKIVPQSGDIVAVEKKFVLENWSAIDDHIFVVCQFCGEFFGDIFSCGYHTKIEHGEVTGSYMLFPLDGIEIVDLLDFKSCKKCGIEFQRLGQMNDHWRSFPEHTPLKPPPGDYLTLYMCSAAFSTCNKKFRSLGSCLAHLYNVHCKKGQGSEMKKMDLSEIKFGVEFTVSYISQGVECVLPSIELECGKKNKALMVKNILEYKRPYMSKKSFYHLKRRLSGKQ